jgi:hypothetical protein
VYCPAYTCTVVSTHKNGDLSEPRRNQLTRRWEGPSNVTQLVPSLPLVRTCVCGSRSMFADFLPGVQCRGILTTALLLATLFSHFGTQVPPNHKINKQVGQEANVINHNLATFPSKPADPVFHSYSSQSFH